MASGPFFHQGLGAYGDMTGSDKSSRISSFQHWCARGTGSPRRHAVTAQMERLAILGEAHAEIAHEIKNPLTALLLQAQLAQRADRATETKELAARVERSIKKIQGIIDSVQTLVREEDSDPLESVPVSRILEEAAEVSKWTLSQKKIPLSVNDAVGGAIVRCCPSQICQVLVNLIHNARDAVENLKDPWIKIGVHESPSSVSLSVTDAGSGISPTVRSRLMEPYFTTKPKGKGTGLGLSISRRIMERHGGSLFLDAAEPNTCFRLEFPRFPIPA